LAALLIDEDGGGAGQISYDIDNITTMIYKLHGRGKVADKYRACMEARAEALVDRYWRDIENVACPVLGSRSRSIGPSADKTAPGGLRMDIRSGVLLFAAVIPLSIAHAENCQNAVKQDEMNDCAYEAYKRSDAELNALYKQIMSRTKDDSNTAALLIKAQRAWMAFRDAECTFMTSGSVGGSVHPMALSSCLERLSRARVMDLKWYLHCSEGDSACPLPAR
jgi:uncharacterized protein YecT (DUF1311 family)